MSLSCSGSSSSPSIDTQPASSSVSVGGDATFSVAASNATGYQWQVNTGSGAFSAIGNSSVYSGATTATLKITGATIGMDGYQYRAVASGSTSSDATSNAATLTVSKATPTVTVAGNKSNPVIGEQVTFTATLTGASAPTGTVEFIDGLTSLGTGNLSGNTATFVTSALTVGAHSITAKYASDTNNAAATSAAITVTVGQAAPTITSVSPTKGPIAGNTTVTITGTGFTDASGVSFGGTPGSILSVTGDTQISVTTPVHAAGAVDVLVTAPGGTDTASGGFTYEAPIPAPAITGVSPDQGTTVGGTTVTITGTGFTGVTGVSFGGLPATSFTFVNATTITAAIPAHAAGAVDVAVTTPGGTGTGTGAFTYEAPIPAPAITSVSPTKGPIAGNTTVTITGTGFTDASAVRFGATQATSFTLNSATQITATTPAGSGTVGLTVTTPGGSKTLPGAFTYIAAPDAPAIGGVIAGDGEATVSFTAPANDGGEPITGYTVTSSPGTISATGENSPITVTGLTNGTDYTFTVTATNSAGTGAASAASNSATPKGSQTITFANPSAQNFGTTPTLTATASSGEPVSFTSATASICTITSGGALTFVSAGTCTIDANQAGDAAYLAAATVSRSFTVNAVVPGAPVIGAGAAGDGQATISFTAPASTGGSAITIYTVTSSPGSFTAALSTSPITITGLANGTDYTFTVTATNTAGTGATSAASNIVTPTLTLAAPVVNAVSATVAANSSANPVTLNITGGAPASVTVVTNPTNGTATASGTSISYTPTAGYSGPDSFTYEATNATGTSAAATVTITVTAPTLTLTPASGALAGGTVGSAYSQTITAAAGTAPYTFTATGLPANLSIGSSTGLISGTPAGAGSSNVTITVTDAHGATGSAAYTLLIGPAPTVDFTFSPAAGALPNGTAGTAYSGSITASEGTAPFTYAVSGTLPPGVTFNGNGAFSGTPTTAGTYPFIVTATDNASPANTDSAAYTVTIGAAPAVDFTFLPAAGALSNGTAGTAYSGSITASGSTAPFTYAVSGTLPPGVTLTGNGSFSGTPATAGTYSFTVTATDSATPANTDSAAYTLVIDPSGAPSFSFSPSGAALPDGEAGEPYNSTISVTGGGTGPYNLALVGALPDGLTFDSSTGIITGTPASDGSFTVTIEATDDTGATDTAVYTLDIGQTTVPPDDPDPEPDPEPQFSLSPAAGSLTDAITGKSYSQTISPVGAVGPFQYELTGDLPDGLHFDRSSGEISGEPTRPGEYHFTVKITDQRSFAGWADYSITVAEPPAVTFEFTTSDGGTLPKGMPEEDYSASITATGGTNPLTYALDSGELPKGITLDPATGDLTGTLAADAVVKDYSFTIRVTDANGSTGTASFTITVEPRTVTAADKTIPVPAGSTPLPVDLEKDATGGPFISAAVAFVEPANAGTAEIILGELADASAAPVDLSKLTFKLKFTPNPAFSGTAIVGYRLTSSLGTSNTGNVSYLIALDVAEVVADIDSLVHGFVSARMGMVASTIEVPGLLERRRMGTATDPVTGSFRPNGDGLTLNFASSLVQMRAAGNAASAAAAGVLDIGNPLDAPFNIWVDGTLMVHNREQNGNQWGSFAMLSLGADYLITDKALVGVSFHLDHMTDPTDSDAELTGDGWLAGPYASVEIGEGVFFDASLLYGGSANDIDTAFWDGSFDTTRWMLDASLTGQWHLDELTTLTPKLRAVYFNEEVADYTVSNAAGDTIGIDGFTQDQFRLSVGAELEHVIALENGLTLTPSIGVTAGLSTLDAASLFGSLTTGFTLSGDGDWTVDGGVLMNFDDTGAKSAGGKVGIRVGF